MAHAVVMPQAGQSMTEGKIVQWLAREGEKVRRGDPLLTIETDKANMDVEAPADGILRKVFHREGEIVPVLQAVAVIAAADEKVDLEALRAAAGQAAGAKTTAAAAPARESPAPAAKPAAVMASAAPAAPPPLPLRGGRPRASPLARRMADLRGVDLRALRGSGPQGRIIRRDVESAPAGAAGPAGFPLPGAAAVPYPPPSPRPPARVAMEGMRKAIAAALVRSASQAPHFYLTVEIDVTAALEMRRGLAAGGAEISINDLIVQAAAAALADEPRVNCRVFDDRIEYPEDVNIGVAVGLDESLVVPVVMQANRRGLAGNAAECRRVVEAARQGKLIGSGQGTFTISNLGMHGVESFTAVINPPEGAILAVGAALPRLVPAGGGFFPRSVLKATLSADHRAIDGLLAAKFMGRLKRLLEEPSRLPA